MPKSILRCGARAVPSMVRMELGNERHPGGSCQTRPGRWPLKPLIILGALSLHSHCFAELDGDLNQLSDVWQRKFGVGALPATADSDGDGFTNAQENRFGTDPVDATSRPTTSHSMPFPNRLDASWHGEKGKLYTLETSENLLNWALQSRQPGQGGMLSGSLEGAAGQSLFMRVGAADVDTDGDGLTDWEELSTGFNPARIYSEGLGTLYTNTDKNRLASALAVVTNTITIAAADSAMSEAWPDPGRVVVRRTGNLNKVNVFFSYGGTATNGSDYSAPVSMVTIPFGADEKSVSITPLADAETELSETVTLTLLTDSAYTLGSASTATLNLADSSGGTPTSKAVARFLTQATLGPAPAELTRVKNLGYSAWIEEQFLRPVNLHLPIVQTWQTELQTSAFTNSSVVNSEHRMEAWWRQSMKSDTDSDPLRQRMAFALSQIFVISDRMESLNNDQRAMTSYYDTLLTHSFGTYRQLLESVTRHPWMGLYLSALKNRKTDGANRFPDENYAREVMQLFSIGLWLLNPDGTQKLSNGSDLGPDGETIPAGDPIPSYGQDDVSEIARVFTGMSYSMRFTSGTNPAEIPNTSFSNSSNNIPWHPMRMFDGEHDIAAKSISLPGAPTLALPARAVTPSNGQTEGDADLAEFLDFLTNHPNTAPFISRLLIQRLVTSNPTPAYVARVASAFTSSPGGDLKQVIRAILLDSEARDYSTLSDPAHGLVREPYTRYIAMARVFEAAPADPSAGGRYRGFSSLDGDFLQRPLSAPSVFNFYSPENKPAGPLRDAGLVSPEMQITNSVSSITGPNVYSNRLSVTNTTVNATSNVGWTQINNTLQNEALWNTRINEQPWIDLATSNPAALAPDAMVAKLDEMLCYGNMSQSTFRAITRALNRQSDPFSTSDPIVRPQYIRARLRNAIHLITTSADYAVLK